MAAILDLDPEKCVVTIETSRSTSEKPSITLKIELFDSMLTPVDKSQFNTELLTVKINGLSCENAHINTAATEEDINNVLYLNVVQQSGGNDCTSCIIRLKYGDDLLGKEIVHVARFLESNYFDKGVNFPSFSLRIMNVPISKLTGLEDWAVVNNINRVVNSEYLLRSRDFQVDRHTPHGDGDTSSRFPDVDVDISKFCGNREECNQIYDLLSLYIKGLHYRNEATKLNLKREEWKAEAIKENEKENFQKSSECKSIKEHYSKLMDEAHLQASEALFKFFNWDRSTREIDLHGQLVADEEKLEEYRKQLEEKFSEDEADDKVKEERIKMDEALRHLRKADAENRRNRDWLEIIVGAGHHSQDNRQRIRTKVEEFLEKKGVRFQKCNKGSLLIKYREYTGAEPCFGSFYCKKCNSSWKSPLCWKGFWQLCRRCFENSITSECLPMQLIAHSECTIRKYRNYASNFQNFHRKLCQKCRETHTYCKYLRS